jgi:hypothetical protein
LKEDTYNSNRATNLIGRLEMLEIKDSFYLENTKEEWKNHDNQDTSEYSFNVLCKVDLKNALLNNDNESVINDQTSLTKFNFIQLDEEKFACFYISDLYRLKITLLGGSFEFLSKKRTFSTTSRLNIFERIASVKICSFTWLFTVRNLSL